MCKIYSYKVGQLFFTWNSILILSYQKIYIFYQWPYDLTAASKQACSNSSCAIMLSFELISL